MNRRGFITVAAAAAMPPRIAYGQQAGLPIVGFLSSTQAAPLGNSLAALKLGLRQEGLVEHQTVAIEYRWADNQYERLADLTADLIRRQVSVIVAAGGTVTPLVAKAATATVPIVFTGVSDPVRAGLVASLSRPGGNVTGVSVLGIQLDAKRLELMSVVIPGTGLIGVLYNPNNPASESQTSGIQAAALAIGREVVLLPASLDADLTAAVAGLTERGGRALVVAADPLFVSRREQLVELTARHALPAIYQWREFVEVGGLMSYGPSLEDAYQQAGRYAGRIIKGEKPSELPVIQSSRIDLVLNMSTAKSLGIVFPQSIILRASEVVE